MSPLALLLLCFGSAAGLPLLFNESTICAGGLCEKPNLKYERIVPSQPGYQWDDAGGYCGSWATQRATMAIGAWVSQQQVRDHTSPCGGHDDEILSCNIEEVSAPTILCARPQNRNPTFTTRMDRRSPTSRFRSRASTMLERRFRSRRRPTCCLDNASAARSLSPPPCSRTIRCLHPHCAARRNATLAVLAGGILQVAEKAVGGWLRRPVDDHVERSAVPDIQPHPARGHVRPRGACHRHPVQSPS